MKKCIFFVVDKNSYTQLILCLKSLSVNVDSRTDVIVCSIDLDLSQRDSISKILKCHFINHKNISGFVGPVMLNLVNKVNPESFWSRFLIWFDPIFAKYDFVLYMDVDVIILKPLTSIFKEDFYIEYDMQENTKGIFIDGCESIISNLLQQDQISIPSKMANAGIFCVPKNMISAQTKNQFILLLGRYGKYLRFADQSLINIWLYRNSIKIQKNNIFNLQYRNIFNKYLFTHLKQAHIIHFNGLKNIDRIILMKSSFLLLNGSFGYALHVLLYLPFCFKNFTFRVLKKFCNY